MRERVKEMFEFMTLLLDFGHKIVSSKERHPQARPTPPSQWL